MHNVLILLVTSGYEKAQWDLRKNKKKNKKIKRKKQKEEKKKVPKIEQPIGIFCFLNKKMIILTNRMQSTILTKYRYSQEHKNLKLGK